MWKLVWFLKKDEQKKGVLVYYNEKQNQLLRHDVFDIGVFCNEYTVYEVFLSAILPFFFNFIISKIRYFMTKIVWQLAQQNRIKSPTSEECKKLGIEHNISQNFIYMCVHVKKDLELLQKYNFIIYSYKIGYCL